MYTKAAVLKTVRIMHLYLGAFLAPAIIFFSFTGALQTFSLHESVKGSSYKPANWIMVLGQLHKKQTAQLPPRKTQPSASSLTDARSTSQGINSPTQVADRRPRNPLPLKIFFLITSIGLSTSTATGLYMSYKYSRNKVLVVTLFMAGIVVPVSLTLAQ
jgi:hypothetical protein